MQFDISEVRLPNPGVTIARIPVRVFAELTNDLQNQLNNGPISFNSGLAGHIQEEYVYNISPPFKRCVDSMFQDYRKRFDFYPNNDYNIETASWVNLQKKNEYNPIHMHYEDISWVLWVTIPYDLTEEASSPNVKNSNEDVASKFQFVYNRLDGGISTFSLNIDNSYEGCLMMFPSYLKHCVYPFQTSDEYRISIAGNISIIK